MLYLTWQDESDWNEVQWIIRLIGVHLGMGILFISSLLDVLATAGQGMPCFFLLGLALFSTDAQ